MGFLIKVWKFLASATSDSETSTMTCIFNVLNEFKEAIRMPLIHQIRRFFNQAIGKMSVKLLIISHPKSSVRNKFVEQYYDLSILQAVRRR